MSKLNVLANGCPGSVVGHYAAGAKMRQQQNIGSIIVKRITAKPGVINLVCAGTAASW